MYILGYVNFSLCFHLACLLLYLSYAVHQQIACFLVLLPMGNLALSENE